MPIDKTGQTPEFPRWKEERHPLRGPAPGQGPDELNDIGGDGGGQRSEVGLPYNGEGGVRRGVEKELREAPAKPDTATDAPEPARH